MKPNSSYGPPPLFMLLSRGCIHWVKLRPVDKYCKRDKTEGVQHKKSWYQGGNKNRNGKRQMDSKTKDKNKGKERKTLAGGLNTEHRSSRNLDRALEQIEVSYCCGLMDGWGKTSLPLLPTLSICRKTDYQEGKRSQLDQSRSLKDTGRNAVCTKTNSCNDTWTCEDSFAQKAPTAVLDTLNTPMHTHEHTVCPDSCPTVFVLPWFICVLPAETKS